MEGRSWSADARAADEVRAATLDALFQGVVVSDARGPDEPVVYANDAFCRLTGYARQEVLGRNCRFLQGPSTDAATLAELRLALAEDEPFFGRILNYRRDGTPFWNALSITPLHDEDGVTSHHVATQTDLTALRRLDLLAEQHGRLALVDVFARGVAHDFNNVLLAASGYAELLGTKLVDPEHEGLRHWTQQIVGACESGRQLTQQLLSFSRGRTVPGEPVDVAALAAETVADVHGLVPAGVSVRVELPDVPAIVLGDRSQVAQVLLNLLVNARDAVGASGEIVVVVAVGDAKVELEVRDTGGTVAAADRVFDAFFTARDAGNGLGLLTTNALVRGLGGSVDVQAEPGVGTTMVVSLPRAVD